MYTFSFDLKVTSDGKSEEIETSSEEKADDNAELKSIQEEIRKDIQHEMKMQNDMSKNSFKNHQESRILTKTHSLFTVNKVNPLDNFLSDHPDNEVEILSPKTHDRILDVDVIENGKESNSVHGFDFADFEKPRLVSTNNQTEKMPCPIQLNIKLRSIVPMVNTFMKSFDLNIPFSCIGCRRACARATSTRRRCGVCACARTRTRTT